MVEPCLSWVHTKSVLQTVGCRALLFYISRFTIVRYDKRKQQGLACWPWPQAPRKVPTGTRYKYLSCLGGKLDPVATGKEGGAGNAQNI